MSAAEEGAAAEIILFIIYLFLFDIFNPPQGNAILLKIEIQKVYRFSDTRGQDYENNALVLFNSIDQLNPLHICYNPKPCLPKNIQVFRSFRY